MPSVSTDSKAKAPVAADVVTAAKAALVAAAARKAARAVVEAQPLSAADRENPDKLTGEDLRALAHRRGVARSEAEAMSDDKLRMQLRYITNRQYTEEG
jgi:hypothetical protein